MTVKSKSREFTLHHLFEEKSMNNETKYTDMPEEYVDSFNRSVRVSNFELTPESVREFVTKRAKKDL